MSGPAGPAIGTGVANPNPIGGATRVNTDGGTDGRGCLENFIGFGKGLTSQEPLPEDFSAADDTVTEANTLAQQFAPTYTPVVGSVPPASDLTWVDTTP